MGEPAGPRWKAILARLNPRNWWWPEEWWRASRWWCSTCSRRCWLLDFVFPPPLTRFEHVSGVVMDKRGAVLRVFPVDDGKWRMRAHVEELDPDFVSSLMAYEDKRFMFHGGVDFAALARATGSLVTSGRIVSGGSTLTMQTARLLEPRPRNIGLENHRVDPCLAARAPIHQGRDPRTLSHTRALWRQPRRRAGGVMGVFRAGAGQSLARPDRDADRAAAIARGAAAGPASAGGDRGARARADAPGGGGIVREGPGSGVG